MRPFDAASLVLGAALVVLGVVLLAGRQLGLQIDFLSWPFFVIVPGILLFVLAASVRPASAALMIPASIVTMTGLLLLYQNTTGHWESWAYAWTLVTPTAVGIGLVLGGLVGERPHQVAVGRRLITVGLVLFLAGGVFFEAILNISGRNLGRLLFPALLIGLGIVLLVTNLFRGRSSRPDVAA